MTMSVMSALKKTGLAVAITLLLYQTVMKMLAYTASSMTVPNRKIISALKKRKESYQSTKSALTNTITS